MIRTTAPSTNAVAGWLLLLRCAQTLTNVSGDETEKLRALAEEKATLCAEQLDAATWGATRATLAAVFAAKPRDEWAAIYRGTDACVTPVLTLREAHADPHSVARRSFAAVASRNGETSMAPAPAPRLSATPARDPAATRAPSAAGAATEVVLRECGVDADSFAALVAAGVCAPTPPGASRL